MSQRGWCNSELVGQIDSCPGAQQLENGVVVDRVPDAEHDFTRHVGRYGFFSTALVSDPVAHKTLLLKTVGRKIAKLIHQLFSHEARLHEGRFQQGIPAPVIVVDFACANSLYETQEMLEDVPVVSSERSREDSSQGPCIDFFAEAAEEDKALFKDLSHRTS